MIQELTQLCCIIVAQPCGARYRLECCGRLNSWPRLRYARRVLTPARLFTENIQGSAQYDAVHEKLRWNIDSCQLR